MCLLHCASRRQAGLLESLLLLLLLLLLLFVLPTPPTEVNENVLRIVPSCLAMLSCVTCVGNPRALIIAAQPTGEL